MKRAIVLLAFIGGCTFEPLAFTSNDRVECTKDEDCVSGFSCVGASCVSDEPEFDVFEEPKIVDAGEVDAASFDSGPRDAGRIDGGALDAGDVDGGELDAGDLDGGEVDAGDLDAGGEDCEAEWHFADAISRVPVDLVNVSDKSVPAGYALRLHGAQLTGEPRMVFCNGAQRFDVNMRREARDDSDVVFLFENTELLPVGATRRVLVYDGLATPPPAGQLPTVRSHELALLGPEEQPTLTRRIPAGQESLVLASWLQSDDDVGDIGGLISLTLNGVFLGNVFDISHRQPGGLPKANGLFSRVPAGPLDAFLRLSQDESDGSIVNDDDDRLRNAHLVTAVLPDGAYVDDGSFTGNVGTDNAFVIGVDIPSGDPVLVLVHAMFGDFGGTSASLSLIASGPNTNGVLAVADETQSTGSNNFFFAGIVDPNDISRLELRNTADFTTGIDNARFQIVDLGGFDVFEATLPRSLSTDVQRLELAIPDTATPSEILLLSDISADNTGAGEALIKYAVTDGQTLIETATETLSGNEDNSSAFLSRLELNDASTYAIEATPGNAALEIHSARAIALRYFEVSAAFGSVEEAPADP